MRVRIAVSTAAFAFLCAAANAEDTGERAWLAAVYREFYTGDPEGAFQDYETFPTRFPGHARAPDALLRCALCLEKTGDLEGALRLAKRVKSEFPRASSARSWAEEALKRMEGRAAEKREIDRLVVENEALREEIASLSERFDKATALLGRGAQDEAELKGEIGALKRKIAGLFTEKARLQERLVSRLAKRTREEDIPPEELMRRLETEKQVREDRDRFTAELLFRSGLRFQAEEKLEKAREEFKKCLELRPDHPRAREHLLQVGVLLGDPESMRKKMLRHLEIGKEIRAQENKLELAETLRNAFDLYRHKAFEDASRLFRKALDILVLDLPEGPEFDRQKDLAARYMRLCQKESRSKRVEKKPGASFALEVRLRVQLLSHSRLQRFIREQDLRFSPKTGAGSPAFHAALTPAQKVALGKILEGEGKCVLDENLLLVTETERELRKFIPREDGRPGSGFSMKLNPRIQPGIRRLFLSVHILLAPVRTLEFPGKDGPVRGEEALSQHGSTEVDLTGKDTVLVAGFRNPFPPETGTGSKRREDLVIIIEVVG